MATFNPLWLLGGITGALVGLAKLQRDTDGENRDKDAANAAAAAAQNTSISAKDKIANIYNYNGLNDSTLGRTLFNTDPTKSADATNPATQLKPRALFK
ncbi:MAG: hypothetical protein WCG95_00110 [bacterium]